MKLYEVTFMSGRRSAYTKARSIAEAVAKVKKVLKDSTYCGEERNITGCRIVADEAWPGVFEA